MSDRAKQEDERCHWNGEQRVIRRHLRDCRTPGCEGCQPCTKAHCTMPRCSHHLRDHERLVCDACVGVVRTNLARIVQLCGFAPAVAAASGINSGAAVLAGPVPEHSTFRARWDWAVDHRGLCRCPTVKGASTCPDLRPMPEDAELCEKADRCEHYVCRRLTYRPTCPGLVAWLDTADGDERHPLWVLGTWDMLVSEHLGHHRTLKVTVDRAASYLSSSLTELARLDDFAFDELADEVEDCVTYVEGVLLLRARPETGAPCPVCHAQGRKAKPLVREYDEDDRTGDSDLWVCPRAECGQTWKPDEYDKYVERESVTRADRLTASQIVKVYRVSQPTLRQWVKRGRVQKRGTDSRGRQLYDTAQVKAMRDRTAVVLSRSQGTRTP